MKTIAYLRVSKDSQDVKNQRLAILEFARHEHREIGEFMELQVSSRRSPKERQLDVLLARLEPGDTLMVSELSRMGRSVGEIITTVDTLVKKHIRLIAIKEGIRLERRQNLQTKVAQFIGVCSSVKTCDNRLRISDPFPTRSHDHRRGSSMPVLSYVHQLFNAETVSSLHPYVALERSAPPMSSVSEPQRRSLGRLPLPARTATLPL